MRQLKLLGLLGVMLVALSGFGAVTARAEGEAAILCLVECGKGLLIKLNGKIASLVGLSGKSLTIGAVETTASVCEGIPGSGDKAVNLCKNTIKYTGVKKEATACRSENTKGEKDAIETVLAMVDLHLAAEQNAALELQPLFLIRTLGQSGEEELIITCGLVKVKERGTVGCLLRPGLTEIAPGEPLDMICKVNATTHDPETGKCEVSCEWLTTHPLELSLNGSTFEDGWLAFEIAG